MAKMGRASIFRDKVNGVRIQAIITQVGGQQFEQARKGLARLCAMVQGEAPAVISDADVVEYLARGPKDTLKYLRRK